MVRPGIRSFALLLVLSGSTAVAQPETPSPDPSAKSSARAATSSPKLSERPTEVQLSAPSTAILNPYRPQEQLWLEMDYVAACLSGSRLPPLVTASPPGMPRAQAGVLGAPGTVVLFGDEKVNDDFRSGVRFRVGGWLDECRTTGLELSVLTLDRQSRGFVAGSPDGNQIISRPFFDAQTGRSNAELVSFPGVLAGTVAVDADSNTFCAVDLLCRKSICRDCCGYLDVLAGYRYLQFGDGVRITENLQTLAPPGTQILLADEFRASNRFQGGALGIAAGYYTDGLSFEARALVAIGETMRKVSINGATQVTAPGQAPTIATGGLLAQSTNIGTFRSSDWAIVPELDLTVGYRLTSQCRVLAGYSVLYWPAVARAAEQIDPVVNPSQLPPGTLVGPARPAFVLSRSDLWVHGFSIGVEFRY